MKKYYYILLIVVLSAIAGSVIYWRSQRQIVLPATQPVANEAKSEDDTSNWKTYRNNEYSYSIQYPNNWEYTTRSYTKDAETIKSVHFNEIGKSYYVEGGVMPLIIISMEKNVKNTTAFDLARQGIDGEKNAIEVKIGGNQVAQINNYLGLTTYVVRNNKIYTLATPNFGNEDINKAVRDVYSKLLSTFKFLDAEAISTADWNIYQSEKYGFEFKYPNTWPKLGEVDSNGHINLDKKYKEFCEGIDCYLSSLQVVDISKAKSLVFSMYDQFKIDKSINFVSDSIIGDLQKMIYLTYDSCNVKHAIIIGTKNAVLIDSCLGGSAQRESEFDALVSTFKFLK